MNTVQNRGFVSLKRNVIDKGLCTYCGTCVGICPRHTLLAENGAIINQKDDCINCGLCSTVCPGGSFDYQYYNQNIFGSVEENSNMFVGYYRSIFKGCSNNDVIRECASSGGFITQFVNWLINNRYADAVVCAGNVKIPNLEVHAQIVMDYEEIIRCAGSKYMLFPGNTILEEILRRNRRYVMVCLPCQVQGLRKAIECLPQLKNKIVLIVGLFCGFNMTKQGTEFLIRKSGIAVNHISQISYRKKEYGTTGFYISGEKKAFFIPKHGYTFLNLFYSPQRCLKCYDYSAEFADISVGDAWEYPNGGSRIIVRTESAAKLLDLFQVSDEFLFEKSSVEDIIQTQKSIIQHKKIDIRLRQNEKPFPEYNADNLQTKLTFSQFMHAVVMSFILKIAHSPFGHFFLEIMPFNFLVSLCSCIRQRNISEDLK